MTRPGILLLIPLLAASVPAQTASTNAIQANGTASISAKPDKAELTVGVVTQGTTAQEAAASNASQTVAVIATVQQVLGSAGTVQTIAYSVTPQYSTTSGQARVIVGYQATNTVQVTTTDLSLPGKIIDAASQAGASTIGSLSFGLQDSDPIVQQALTQAARQALAHASAIAAGLGTKTGAVLSAQEGATITPYAVTGTTASTPVLTGTVTVSASVTINVQMVQ